MKFTTKVKPVKIRVISGGEEHSSIETLKKNFDFGEVMNLIQDHRMSTWLRRQHQDEMAQKVEELITSGALSIKDETQNLVRLYEIFFPENEVSSISDIIQNWKGDNVYQKNIESLNRHLKSQNDTLLLIGNILRGIRIKKAEIHPKDRESFKTSSARLKNTISEQIKNNHSDLSKLKKLFEDFLVDYYLLHNDTASQKSFNDVLQSICEMKHIPSFLIMQDIISSSKHDASFSTFIEKETGAFNDYFKKSKDKISHENDIDELYNQMKDFDSKCSNVNYLELVYYLASDSDEQARETIQSRIQNNVDSIRNIDKEIIQSHTGLFDFLVSLCPAINKDYTKELLKDILKYYSKGDRTLSSVKKINDALNSKGSELNYNKDVLNLMLSIQSIRYFIYAKNNNCFSLDSDPIWNILGLSNRGKMAAAMISYDEEKHLDGYFEIIHNTKVESPKIKDLLADLETIIHVKRDITKTRCLTVSEVETSEYNCSRYKITLPQNTELEHKFIYEGNYIKPNTLNTILLFILENLYTILETNE